MDVSSLEINLSLTFFFLSSRFFVASSEVLIKKFSYYYIYGIFLFFLSINFSSEQVSSQFKVFTCVYVKCETSNIFIVGSVDRH